MLINHLKQEIFIPTLDYLSHCSGKTLNSNSAIKLLLMTCATETLCGKFLTQWPSGIGLGVFQIEPATHYDLYENYLQYNQQFLAPLNSLKFSAEFGGDEPNLIGNLYYSTAVARLIYWRQPEKLPALDDNEGMWNYYKKYFNSIKGKATKELFFKHSQYCGIIDVDISEKHLDDVKGLNHE